MSNLKLKIPSLVQESLRLGSCFNFVWIAIWKIQVCVNNLSFVVVDLIYINRSNINDGNWDLILHN